MFWLKVIQIIIAILLTIAILLQNRGAGSSGVFGGIGGGNVYSTKRGVEKFLFRATIVLVILFFAASMAGVIL